MSSFETKRILLTSPVNLSADSELGAADSDQPLGGFIFVQNTGPSLVYWRETLDPPDPPTETGPCLAAGDGVVARLLAALPFWAWSADGEGEITISVASPAPVREV